VSYRLAKDRGGQLVNQTRNWL